MRNVNTLCLANAITTATTGPTIALQMPSAISMVEPWIAEVRFVLDGTSGAISVTFTIEKSDSGTGTWTTAMAAVTMTTTGPTKGIFLGQQKFEGSYFRVNISAISGTGAALTVFVGR